MVTYTPPPQSSRWVYLDRSEAPAAGPSTWEFAERGAIHENDLPLFPCRDFNDGADGYGLGHKQRRLVSTRYSCHAPSRPNPGSLRAGRLKSTPATAPRMLTSIPSTHPTTRPSRDRVAQSNVASEAHRFRGECLRSGLLKDAENGGACRGNDHNGNAGKDKAAHIEPPRIQQLNAARLLRFSNSDEMRSLPPRLHARRGCIRG
jgi:hypothetical protein